MLTLKRSANSLEAPLREARTAAAAEIIAITDRVRTRYLTPIVGQELTYKEKEDQAKAFLAADPEPTEPGDEFTFIFGEVGITAATPFQVAQVVLFMANLFRTSIGPKIERLRLLVNKNVAEAQTVEAVQQAVKEFAEDMEEML